MEWKANGKRMNMALETQFTDGESSYGTVDSWSTGEEFAGRLLKRRGLTEVSGWTVSLNEVDSMRELNGTDFVLDLISQMEMPPAFPVCQSHFVTSYDKQRRHNIGAAVSGPSHSDMTNSEEISPDYSGSKVPHRESRPVNRISRERILERHREDRRSRSLSRERIEMESMAMASTSVEQQRNEPAPVKIPSQLERLGLSKSKLNDRYHSMENLVDRQLAIQTFEDEWKDIGLASSSLNDRYFQQKAAATAVDHGRNTSSSPLPKSPVRGGRIAEIKKNLRGDFNSDGLSLNGHSNGESSDSPTSSPDLTRSPPNPDAVDFPEFDFEHELSGNGESKSRRLLPLIPRPSTGGDHHHHHGSTSSSSRYIKSNSASKKSHPQIPASIPSQIMSSSHSHTTKAQIETRIYDTSSSKDTGARSSALSDTSEAPSLASHVRRVRVPSQASDLDQYLDDLFNPVLEGNLDELSDARSLAASIKGGGSKTKSLLQNEDHMNHLLEHELSDARSLADSINGGSSKIKGLLRENHMDHLLERELSDARSLSDLIKSRSSKRKSLLNEDYMNDILDNISLNESLNDLEDVNQLIRFMKGGVDTQQNPATLQPSSSYSYQMRGMVSPPPISGIMSPPPPLHAPGSSPNMPAMFGGIPPVLPPLNLNTTLPLYNLGGFNIPFLNAPPTIVDPSQQMALQQQLMQQQFQYSAVSSQMQQLQQRAFLASAVQQNIQLQQQLMQQNQTLQQLLQQQAQPHQVNMEGAVRTSTPLTPDILDSPPILNIVSGNTGYRNSDLHNTSGSKFHVSRFSQDNSDHHHNKSRNSNVNLNGSQDPDRSWSGSSSPHSGGQPKMFQERMPPLQDRYHLQNQMQGGSDNTLGNAMWYQAPPPMKMPTSSMSMYNDVMTEMKMRRNSAENSVPVRRGKPPPPPPPLPPSPPEATHPFVDVFGRAKTVRIGKWRWPPRQSESEEELLNEIKNLSEEETDGRRGSDSSGGEKGEKGLNLSRESISEQQLRQTAGSVGKLKISTEMRAKLEAVTLNHSVRQSDSRKTDARRVYAAVNKLKAQAKDGGGGRQVKKLEDSRKNALQMKLTGRGKDYADGSRLQKAVHEVRSVQSFTTSPPPPPPPVAPPSFNIPPPPPPSSGYGDAASSYYGHTSANPEPKLPPRPISPSAGRYIHHRSTNERIEHDDSVSFARAVENVTKAIDEVDRKHLEGVRTKLCPMATAPYCTYTRVPWTLNIRKEVFTPTEQLTNPLALHMVFSQIVSDTYWKACVRIPLTERQKMRQMLDNYGITTSNVHSPHHKVTIKKNIVDIAREWPTYFCRLFPVQGGRQFPEANYLGVSHAGIYLIQNEAESSESLHVLSAFNFEDVLDTSCPRSSSLQILMRNGGRITLYSHKFQIIRSMIEQFCVESETGGQEYVRAVADYVTRESTLLSFHRGDVIRVIHRNKYLEKGWLYGEVGGRTGIFPCEYVVPLSRNELAELTKQKPYRRPQHHRSPSPGVDTSPEHGLEPHKSATNHSHNHNHQQQVETTRISTQNHVNSRQQHHSPSRISPPGIIRSVNGSAEVKKDVIGSQQSHWTEHTRDYVDDKSDISQMTTPTINDGKHSLLQFALVHFRQSLDKYEMLRTADGSIRGSLKMIESMKAKKKNKKGKETDWTWREQVDMVKYTKSPIQASLLKLDLPELNKLALECFIAIMRFMGDYPMTNDLTEVECVYAVLINCHRHPALRDEIYCQIMKQTTNNKSSKADSCQRGWRLFSILAAYFQCSDLLKPYLFKYLETAAYDKRRAYHGTAMVCLQNLRKTFKCGGRKNVPSIEEVAAISAGRNSKRQIYRLPGGTERVINTKSTSVVQDIIEEICSMLNVRNQHEMEEFSLYCIVEGDTFTMPLAREEYILDVTTELQRNQQIFYLIFCRSVWYYPMRLDNQLYIEVVFNQIAPDYLEGLLLVMPGGQLKEEHVYDLSRVAALLHRAAQMDSMPTLKETKYLLPKPVLTIREIKPPQWVNMVQDNWKEAERLSSTEAKAQVLEILQNWPLFGSSFFAVKKISDKETGDAIMALNRNGVHFLDVIAHETFQCYPFSEVISTRKVRAEDGTLFLDMKCGNLMVQKITRIQTDQAHEISRLIRQYITIEQRNRGLVPGEAFAPETNTVPR